MTSIWAILTLILLLASLYGHLLFAGLKQPLAYAAIAAVTAGYLAFLAIATLRSAEAAGDSRARLASISARHIAYVWVFGSMAMFLVYGFALTWREWLTFGLGMAFVGALSYGLAILFDRDASKNRSDAALLTLGRNLNIAQVAGMVITMAGLLLDRKMAVALAANRSDWAANSTFFTGAAAIAAIGTLALLIDKRAAARTAAPTGAP